MGRKNKLDVGIGVGIGIVGAIAVLATMGIFRSQAAGPNEWPGAAADHHIHIRTKDAASAIGLINTKLGDMETDIIQQDMPAVTAQEIIAELDKAGIRQGVLLSVAYFFGMPEYDGEDEYGFVQRENNYTIAQARLFPDRLIAFCSVNPLKEYAVDEINRCARELKSPGLKLHMSAVGADLRNPEHITRIRAAFLAAHSNRMAVTFHMRSRSPDFGPQDVETLLNEILIHTPDLPLHIAHLGGWGGYDKQTDAALQTWILALDEGEIVKRSHVTFDMAAIVFDESSDQENHFAVGRLREIGLENIIFGTDWTYLQSPDEYQDLLFDKLQPIYSEKEIALMMSNKAHYLRN